MDIWYDHISQNYVNVIHEYTIMRDIGIVITVIGYEIILCRGNKNNALLYVAIL